MQGVFQIGADDRRGGFRAERQRFFAPVDEGIHLFFDDIRRFTYPPPEKLCLLQKGNADLAESEGAKNIGRRVFYVPPFVCFRGENILETLDGR